MTIGLTELKENFEKQLAYIVEWVSIGEEDKKQFVQNTVAHAIYTVEDISIAECDKVYSDGLEIKEYNFTHIDEITSLLRIAFALLTKYGLTRVEYLEWVKSQNTNADLFLYGLVGEEVSKEEKKAVRDAIVKEILKMPPAYKTIQISDSPREANAHSFHLLDKYIVFESEFEKQLEIRKFMDGLIEDGIEDWDHMFDQEIHTLDQCIDKLPALSNLFISRTLSRSLRFLKKQGITDEKDKLRFEEEFYYQTDIFEKYYDDFMDEYVKILETLDKGIAVNFLHQLSQAKGEWSGGGFGVKGAVTGAVIAGMANVATDAVGEISGFLKEKIILGNWEAKKNKLYKSSEFREGFWDYIINAIYALYPAFAQALHIEILEESEYQMEKNLEKILSKEIRLSDENFKKFCLMYLIRLPFDVTIYSIIFKKYGSDCGKIEDVVEFLGIDSEYHEKKVKFLRKIEQETLNQYDEYDRQELDVLISKLTKQAVFYGIEKSDKLKQLEERKVQADKCYADKILIDNLFEEDRFNEIVEMALSGVPYAEHVVATNYYNDSCQNCDLMKVNDLEPLGKYAFDYHLYIKYEFDPHIGVSNATTSKCKEYSNQGIISASIGLAQEQIEYWYGDTKKGLRMLRELALWQQPEAAFLLGYLYYYGHRVEKDKKYALKYLCQAGGDGHKRAIDILKRDEEYANKDSVKEILLKNELRIKKEEERKAEEEKKKAAEEERKKAEAAAKEAREKEEAKKQAQEEAERQEREDAERRKQEELKLAALVEKTIQNEEMKQQVKEMMFCPYCGNKILRSVKFCNFCGKKNSYTGGLL